MEKYGPAALRLLAFKKEGGKLLRGEVGESQRVLKITRMSLNWKSRKPSGRKTSLPRGVKLSGFDIRGVSDVQKEFGSGVNPSDGAPGSCLQSVGI